MSAECSRCGFDIVYPAGTWPVGLCQNCTQADRIDELEDALLYALGYDLAGWPGHLRPTEILERVGVDPVVRRTA